MKILFFIKSLAGGGAEKVLVDTVMNLNKDKYQITVYSLFNEGVYNNLISNAAEYKYYFKGLNSDSRMNMLGYKVINKLLKICPAAILHKIFIKDNHYDFEVAFLEGISTKVISGGKKVKKFAWVHTDLIAFPWTESSYLCHKQEIKSYKNYDRIFCVSKQVKDAFEKKYLIKAEIQHNLLNDKEIRSKSMELLDDMETNREITILAIGRLIAEKGFDRLLRIHKRLIDKGFQNKLFILGEGNERKSLEKYIEDNNLFSSTKLLGFKNNPYKYIKNADLFVCSSIVEGLSTVVMESLILGVPVITTSCAGMTDLLGNSEYGLITENSEEGLYLGLKKIIQDKSLYNYYKEKALERGKYFSLEKRLKEFDRIFDELYQEN